LYAFSYDTALVWTVPKVAFHTLFLKCCVGMCSITVQEYCVWYYVTFKILTRNN